MERDFCENQTEIITDVSDSVEGAWKQLAVLQKEAVIIFNEKTRKTAEATIEYFI